MSRSMNVLVATLVVVSIASMVTAQTPAPAALLPVPTTNIQQCVVNPPPPPVPQVATQVVTSLAVVECPLSQSAFLAVADSNERTLALLDPTLADRIRLLLKQLAVQSAIVELQDSRTVTPGARCVSYRARGGVEVARYALALGITDGLTVDNGRLALPTLVGTCGLSVAAAPLGEGGRVTYVPLVTIATLTDEIAPLPVGIAVIGLRNKQERDDLRAANQRVLAVMHKRAARRISRALRALESRDTWVRLSDPVNRGHVVTWEFKNGYAQLIPAAMQYAGVTVRGYRLDVTSDQLVEPELATPAFPMRSSDGKATPNGHGY